MYEAPPLASEQCTAMSKRTRRRCGQLVPGGGVCQWHGGAAGQVARAREARQAVAEAQVIFGGEYVRRHPGEVLVAAVADSDAILQRLKAKVELADRLTAADVDALGAWLDRVSRLSKAVLDAGLEERLAKLQEVQMGDQAQVIAAVLRATLEDLGHDLADPHVLQIVSARVREMVTGEAPAPSRRALSGPDVVDLA